MSAAKFDLSQLDELLEAMAVRVEANGIIEGRRPGPMIPKDEVPVGGAYEGNIASIKAWVKNLTRKVRRNKVRLKNWRARMTNKGIAGEGVPFPGMKSGSPIRAVGFTFLGIPRPKLMKTKGGRAVAREVDKMWKKRGVEINYSPKKGEKEFYTVKNAGRLSLVDEVEVLRKALNIRPRNVIYKDKKTGKKKKRLEHVVEIKARIEKEGRLVAIKGQEALFDAAIGLAAFLSLAAVGVYDPALVAKVMSTLSAWTLKQFI